MAKPSAAEKKAKRKQARQRFNGSASSGAQTITLCEDSRKALETALTNQEQRKTVVKATGLPFNQLSRIATGATPARPYQTKAILSAADTIGFTPAIAKNG